VSPGGGKGGRGDRLQLPVVAIAAQPGILGRDLTPGCRGGHVEVVGNLTALTGGFEATQEAPALGLTVGRVELAQDVGFAGVWLAVDLLRLARAKHGAAAARVGTGEDQVGDTPRVVDREALGDEAAHRPAEDVGWWKVDRLHQPGGGVGERVEAAPVPRPRAADAGVVEEDQPVIPRQQSQQRRVPFGHRRTGADQHHQRRPLAAFVPGDSGLADRRDEDLGPERLG